MHLRNYIDYVCLSLQFLKTMKYPIEKKEEPTGAYFPFSYGRHPKKSLCCNNTSPGVGGPSHIGANPLNKPLDIT